VSDSFPCLICGKRLDRMFDEHEAQPDDGVMCRTGGNYGSTIFDPVGGEVIDFNICDPCFVQAGKQGRLFIRKASRPISSEIYGERVIVGNETLHDRAHVPWTWGLPADNTDIFVEPEALRAYRDARPDTVRIDDETLASVEAST
jgi:hypothetical protein